MQRVRIDRERLADRPLNSVVSRVDGGLVFGSQRVVGLRLVCSGASGLGFGGSVWGYGVWRGVWFNEEVSWIRVRSVEVAGSYRAIVQWGEFGRRGVVVVSWRDSGRSGLVDVSFGRCE